MTKPIVVTHQDEYSIFDKLKFQVDNDRNNHLRNIRGWVQVFMDQNKVFEGPNLIVAKGREFVAQRLFELNTAEDNNSRPDFFNYKISHFAIGSGGATVSGNMDVNLTGPLIADTGLYKPIILGDQTYLTDPSGYIDNTQSPVINSASHAVKPISVDGSIVLESVPYDGSPNYYTKAKCTCTVPPGQPSALAPGASVPISEAGLYFVNTALADTDVKKVQMFAHICFAPKWKELEGTLTILWYILC